MDSEKEKPGRCTLVVSSYVNDRLEKLIDLKRKYINKKTTKQGWLIDSIKEKIQNDTVEVIKVKHLSFEMDEEIDKILLEKVENARKYLRSYSKKQWILDAILEKLEREEKDITKSIESINSSKKNGSIQWEKYESKLENLKSELNNLHFQISEELKSCS